MVNGMAPTVKDGFKCGTHRDGLFISANEETMTTILIALGAVLGAVALFLAGWFAKTRVDTLRKASAELEVQRLLEEGRQKIENLKTEKLLEAKDEALKLRAKLENDFETKRADLVNKERQIQDREALFNQKVESMEKRSRELKQFDKEYRDKVRQLEAQQKRVKDLEEKAVLKLTETARMNHDEAIQSLRQELLERAKVETAELIKQMRDTAKATAEREAKEVIVQAIQRTAADHSAETTVTVVNIPNDDLKGRIIGREGRNIRAFEACCGVELIIDDTPEAVTLSGFDPFRREVARLALERLIEDGRIHPARIEEVVKKANTDLEERVLQVGEQAMLDVGINGIHPELIKLLGKLHYRTSYGQNVLKHSIEVAKLTAIMASELGLDGKLAARSGLLHDIGKAIDRITEGTHTELGLEVATKYKEPKEVLNAIASHHGDVESNSLIGCLVQAADAVSGARPGARRDSLEGYIHRLEKLEKIASGFNGVGKVFALQAGREIRVMVEHDKVTDALAETFARDIADRIQQELDYPGQIRVTVIREFRAVEFAK